MTRNIFLLILFLFFLSLYGCGESPEEIMKNIAELDEQQQADTDQKFAFDQCGSVADDTYFPCYRKVSEKAKEAGPSTVAVEARNKLSEYAQEGNSEAQFRVATIVKSNWYLYWGGIEAYNVDTGKFIKCVDASCSLWCENGYGHVDDRTEKGEDCVLAEKERLEGTARTLFFKAAEQGHPGAQFEHADFLQDQWEENEGRGSLKPVLELLKKAALQGHQEAMKKKGIIESMCGRVLSEKDGGLLVLCD